jgi:hypothetical protein
MRVPVFLLLLLTVTACGAHRHAGSTTHGASAVGGPAPASAPTSAPPPASGSGSVQVSAGVDATAAAELAAGLLEFGIRATFFGIPVAPPTPVVGDPGPGVVFVLDRSGSMDKTASRIPEIPVRGLGWFNTALKIVDHASGTKLEVAKAELIKAIRALPDGTQFDIIFFDRDIVGMSSGGLLTMNATVRAEAEAFVSRVRPGNSTAAVPALRAAYQSGARRVVLLSDGLANTGGDGTQLLYEAREQIRRGLRFDTVGLGKDQDFSLLQTLASESGGMAVVP